MNEIKKAVGWDSASLSPDYFNSCATYTTAVSVPNNGYNYQKDCAGGGGYAGEWVINVPNPNDGREYINIKLNDTLKQYHKYVAGMFVSLSNYSSYAILSMGMYFSNLKIYSPNTIAGTYINIANPQVKGKFSLTDTLNWMTIQDTFVAQGGELYLTIGNFSADSLSDTIRVQPSGFNGSYYYIDSVTVFDTGLTGIPEAEKETAIINLFPNPGDGNFEIECTFKEDVFLEISDMQGRLIERKKIMANTKRTSLHCENLENGVYLYKVITKEFETISKKLVIVK